MIRYINLISLFIFISIILGCNKSIEPSSVESIELVQVDHPFIGTRVNCLDLDKNLINSFVEDFNNKSEESIKFYSCYVIKMHLKNGEMISYRTNGNCFEKFKDDNTDGIYFKLDEDINLVTKYWGIPKEQFCEEKEKKMGLTKDTVFTIYFDERSLSIKDEDIPKLFELSKICKSEQYGFIKVVAYTDKNGTEKANDLLSEKRANKILQLIDKYNKIDSTKIYLTWMGDSKDVYDLHFEPTHPQQNCVDVWVQRK